MRFDHPIHSLPFDAAIDNDLAAEFRAQPIGRRWQAVRKAAFRELGLVFGGQARRRVARVPNTVGRMLWVYTWTTVGDAIMDLAPRTLVPPHIAIDLLVAPHLAPLFAHDRRFRHVHADVAACAGDYDFVLLDSLRTTSLRLKAKAFPALPFATMRDHQAGERFDRAAYADRRLRQLFGLAGGDVVAPHLDFAPVAAGAMLADVSSPVGVRSSTTRIAVALGARVERKHYRHWPEVLSALVETWPPSAPRPEFVLMGQGASARADAAAFDVAFLAAHARVEVDAGSLADAARSIAGCDAFLGVDGGLMHVAVAVGTAGLAVFVRANPRYFLRPGSTMHALAVDADIDSVPASRVAAAFLIATRPRPHDR